LQCGTPGSFLLDMAGARGGVILEFFIIACKEVRDMTVATEDNKQIARELAQSVAPFESVNAWPAIRKLIGYLLVLPPIGYFAWSSDSTLGFVLFSAAFAVVYGSLMVTTHDCIHQTFTGNKIFDLVFPRLISWPMLWTHGIYDESHKLHHMMNGQELRDPERITFTETEYLQAGFLKRLYIRHQWLFSMLIIGGFGAIYKTVSKGAEFASKSKGMRRNIWADFIGILTFNLIIYSTMFYYGLCWKYLAFYLILERVVGFVMQFRLHIEHYGLWGKGPTFYQAQILNCRNFTTNKFMAWYYNGLCYHTVHHAFPGIPFYHLKNAHLAMDGVYGKYGRKIPIEEDGYLASVRRLSKSIYLIRDDQSGKTGGIEGVTTLDSLLAKPFGASPAIVR
jgi:fatty acid desaturase